MKGYVLIHVKQIPPQSGYYTVYDGSTFLGQDYYDYPKGWCYKIPTHWAKEINFSELMIKLAVWKDRNYHHIENDWYTSLKHPKFSTMIN